MTPSISKERLASFSDGIFAVIITIMVLQLKLPSGPTFSAMWQEWPTALSYVVSYFLIVIMWINHHYLWGYTEKVTARITLWNFLHMFCASLVPFATAWVAATRIASVPVFVYAAVTVMVNLSYHAFAREVIYRSSDGGGHRIRRRDALMRSKLTLALFIVAMLLSLKLPRIAFAMVTLVLLTYACPEVPRDSNRAPW